MLSRLVAKPGQISLALRERQGPEIDGPLEQQVKREESHSRHVGPPLPHLGVKAPEVRVTATIAKTQFPIDDGGVGRERGEGLCQTRQPVAPFGAAL
jgi:hypothetical protein